MKEVHMMLVIDPITSINLISLPQGMIARHEAYRVVPVTNALGSDTKAQQSPHSFFPTALSLHLTGTNGSSGLDFCYVNGELSGKMDSHDDDNIETSAVVGMYGVDM